MGFRWIVPWLGILLWATPGLALEPPRRVELPQPEVFLEEESISLAVLRARPEDAGFRSMLTFAWGVLSQARPGETPPLLNLLLSFMGPRGSEEFLLSFLPVQAVRVDRLDARGRPLATIAYTLSGWTGLQALGYYALATDREGRPYPVRYHRGVPIVLREGWENPARRRVLTRVRGTFVNCPTPDRARAVIDRMLEPSRIPLRTSLFRALGDLDRASDTYGVVLNEGGSLLHFLTWLNRPDMLGVQEQVGEARLQQAAAGVRFMAWEGDLVSADQVDLKVRFRCRDAGSAARLAEVLEEARRVLERHRRVGHLQISTSEKGASVLFSMVGFQAALRSYLLSGP